ncbi:MAG: DNA modification methylase [Sedimentisphaerales bacterium]|jgi:DNA modification methylase
MKIVMISTAKIKPYENNPRLNDQAVDAVAESIKQFGFRQPIVVDKDMIIVCGHTRLYAAKKLGLSTVPVHIARELTPEQVKAYRIADNQTAALSGWDEALLSQELQQLRDMDFDLTSLGFDDEALAKFMDGDLQEGLTDPDDVPLPGDKAVTRPGDLYILGNHRLLCGDSSLTEDVDRLLDGAHIHLVYTDPPYNVNIRPRSQNARAVSESTQSYTGLQGMDEVIQGKAHKTTDKMRPKDRPILNDCMSDEEFAELLLKWFGNIQRVLEPGRSFYLWGGYRNIWNYPNALKTCQLHFSQMIIWVKEHPVLTRQDFMGNHEWCFYGWAEGAAHKFFGPANITDVWSVKKVNPQSMIHLTEKPVELAVRAIQYSSLPGENVLDLFGGSGSTLIAAEQTGRNAFLMEIDPLYCDVICKRFEQFTGKKAVLSAKKRATSAQVARC